MDAPQLRMEFITTSAHIADLPTSVDGVGDGSIAMIKDTGKIYIYDQVNGWGEWGES